MYKCFSVIIQTATVKDIGWLQYKKCNIFIPTMLFPYPFCNVTRLSYSSLDYIHRKNRSSSSIISGQTVYLHCEDMPQFLFLL